VYKSYEMMSSREQHTTLKRILTQDLRSPVLSRLVYSLDAFLDHERSFQEFLLQQGMESALSQSGLRLRNTHKVHAKACITEPYYRSLAEVPCRGMAFPWNFQIKSCRRFQGKNFIPLVS